MRVTDSGLNDRLRDRLVALTRDLILIPSIPGRPEDRRRCFEFVKNHLESLPHIEIREFEVDGIPSLVATPPARKNPEVLMIAHLDVITHPDLAAYRSTLRDGRIYGPGAGDMKGALAILLELFREMHRGAENLSLGLAVTSDEETGGERGAGYLFREAGLRCGVAVIPDGGSLHRVTVEEKGILHVRLRALGPAGHAARPWLTENPIERLLEGVLKVKALFAGLATDPENWHPTCTVTVIGTENETINRIAAEASAILDIRFPQPHTAKRLMQAIQDELDPGLTVDQVISAQPTRLSPDPEYLAAVREVTGEAATLIRDHGGSDARFLSELGIPVVMSRPIVGDLHAQNEWIDVASMVRYYRILERFLEKRFSA
jgi:succinyl-diaminopimelate desuccinylase